MTQTQTPKFIPGNVSEQMKRLEVDLRDDWEGSGKKRQGLSFDAYLKEAAEDSRHVLTEPSAKLLMYQTFSSDTKRMIADLNSYQTAVAIGDHQTHIATARFPSGYVGLSWKTSRTVFAKCFDLNGNEVGDQYAPARKVKFEGEWVFIKDRVGFVLKVFNSAV